MLSVAFALEPLASMRNYRRTTSWNLFFHYVSIGLALVSGVVLVPLYMRFIPLDLYGAWLATGNILAWLTVIDPGLSTVLQQKAGVAYGKGDTAELNSVLTGGILLSGLIALSVLIAGLLSSRFIISWLNLNDISQCVVLERAFVVAVIGSALMIFSYGITAYNQGLQSSIGIGLVYVSTMIASLVVTVLLFYYGVGLMALPIGLVVRGLGLTMGNAIYLVWRSVSEKTRYSFSLKGVGTLAKLSSYTFLGRGAGVLAANLDAFALTRYLGAEVAPIYVLTRKAPDMSRMFLERPAIAFMPAISSLVGSGETERARVVLLRLVRTIVWLMGLIAGGFFLFNKTFVSLWVGPHLYAGATVNLAIVLALVITVVTNALANLCFSLGNIKGNSVISLAQGLVTVPLMILGAKYWGMRGVAIAPIIAMLSISAWYYPYAFSHLLKLEKVEINKIVQEMAYAIASTVVAMGTLYWFTATTWLSFSCAVLSFCAVYMAMLFFLSKTFQSELAAFMRNSYFTRKL